MFEILGIFYIAIMCFFIAELSDIQARKQAKRQVGASPEIRALIKSKRNWMILRNIAVLAAIAGGLFIISYFIHFSNSSEGPQEAGIGLTMIKFVLSSSITWLLISVIMEVYALLSLIKWELIREYREGQLNLKQVEVLFFKGTKIIIGFFVIILGVFYIAASSKFFLSNQNEILSFFKTEDYTGSDTFLLSTLYFAGGGIIFLCMVSSVEFWPKVIFNYSNFPKKPNKVTLEAIFKKKLIAVCIVILAISAPIFLVAIDKYHLF